MISLPVFGAGLSEDDEDGELGGEDADDPELELAPELELELDDDDELDPDVADADFELSTV